ncbi:hypothetical protein CEXT_252591 [Caerostris extrusa]|uniref:Uncharacterized protein n=1 Tax=Caerostris extrusa TaxID=172846 RepID=A0AAV4MXR6_CAEEX|nr:hypothetical protein CEXT_252591 [Caerostris extrusa]
MIQKTNHNLCRSHPLSAQRTFSEQKEKAILESPLFILGLDTTGDPGDFQCGFLFALDPQQTTYRKPPRNEIKKKTTEV